MKKLGILWDLDGTLLNTLEDLTDATNYALMQHGHPARSLQEVRSFVGNGAARLIQLAVPDGADSQPVFDTFRAYYENHCQVKTRPYDGILEALTQVGRQYPMAIVSNKPDFAVKPLCRQYFGDIYALGESAACPRKPSPDMVFQAMEAIGVEACIYVGDSDVDVLTAQNAGVPCLSVLWGFRDRECIENVGGTHFCENPEELLSTLDSIANSL